MESGEQCQIDPALVAALYFEHADSLRAFLWGVLKDADLVADVLQSAFVKAIEQGHAARPESLKAWLFQVAYREALALRRRRNVHDRATRRLFDEAARPGAARPGGARPGGARPGGDGPHELACRRETVEAICRALARLPADQRRVVCARLYEQKKFSQIARDLNVPLGTVLTRMQSALAKLRAALKGQP